MFFGFGFVSFRLVFVFAMVHHIINTGHTLPPLTHKIGSRKMPGGGGLNKLLYGEARPQGPTSYPFIYHFSQKRYSSCIPSIDKWCPFHLPCLELCIPFNCCAVHCHLNRNQLQE